MIKCPRCGFEQPVDTFCASCGVNMQTYKSKLSGPKPMIIGLVAAGIALVVFVAFKISRSTESLEKSASLSGKIFDDFNKELDSSPPPVTAAVAQGPPVEARVSRPAVQAKSVQTKPNPATIAAEISQPTAVPTATPAEHMTNQLTMAFALASKETTEKLSLPVGRVGANIIPKIKYEAAIKEAGFQNLSSETQALNPSQPVKFSQGTQEPRTRENIGFNIDVTLVRLLDTSADYKIQIKRSLPDVSPLGEIRITSQDFLENVTLSMGNVYGISGMLPRKTVLQNEAPLYQTNILRAMLETAFQSSDEEFIIFIVP